MLLILLSHGGHIGLSKTIDVPSANETRTLTEESVGSLIDDYTNISDISTKLGEAFTLAFGERKNKKSPQKATKVVD